MAYRASSDDYPARNREAGPETDEPTLDELLADPIIRQLMYSDRTDEKTVRGLLRRVANPRNIRLANPADDDPREMMPLLADITRLWHKRYDREARVRISGMTYAHSVVLVQLLRHRGINQASLARLLDIRPMSLVHLLNQLEAMGLVVRTPNPRDRKSHVIALTTRARSAIKGIDDLTTGIHRDTLAGISEGEVRHLLPILRRVRSNLLDRPQSGSRAQESDSGQLP